MMNKLFIFVSVLIIATSCISERGLNRLCASRCASIKDSIRIQDSVVVHYRDSIHVVEEKEGPLIIINNPCDSLGNLKPFEIKETKNGITTSVKSDGKKITSNCHEEAYKIQLKNAIIEREIYKNAFHQLVRKEICVKEHRNWLDKFCRWSALIFYLFVAFWIGKRFIRI
jgi:hypothetical protein